jgi:hypothetical protein
LPMPLPAPVTIAILAVPAIPVLPEAFRSAARVAAPVS